MLEQFILNELSLSFFTEQKFTAVWYHFCTIFQTATWYIENGKSFCKPLFFKSGYILGFCSTMSVFFLQKVP